MFILLGRCQCNGHAGSCRVERGTARCRCKHNTKGRQCQYCRDLFWMKPWRSASFWNVSTQTANPCTFQKLVFVVKVVKKIQLLRWRIHSCGLVRVFYINQRVPCNLNAISHYCFHHFSCWQTQLKIVFFSTSLFENCKIHQKQQK